MSVSLLLVLTTLNFKNGIKKKKSIKTKGMARGQREKAEASTVDPVVVEQANEAAPILATSFSS